MSPNELAELAVLSETLNDETNSLNITISTFNSKIAALNLGIEVWLDSNNPEFQIGFAKAPTAGDYSWQLATRSKLFGDEYENEGKDDDWSKAAPLLNASRNLRIEGLAMVPEILSQLKSAAHEKIQVMRRAKQQAASL
jgi:hypothetical protein